METQKQSKATDKSKESATRGGGLGPTKDAHKQHRPKTEEETLDEALEESFPASDPPAQTVPSTQKHGHDSRAGAKTRRRGVGA